MKRVAVMLATGLAFGATAAAQTTPAGRAGSGGSAASRPAIGAPAAAGATATPRKLQNVDTALQSLIKLDADDMPLQNLMQNLQDTTQTNMVVNWNALAKAGITRTTPVTLHLKDLSLEHALRTLLEMLPTTGTRANYAVGENTLEVTTNAELGVDLTTVMYPVKLSITYTLAAAITPEEQAKNTELVEKVLRAELVRAGEPMDMKGHELSIKNTTLAATVSERGQTVIKRAVGMFGAPLKMGQLASGTQLTAQAKKAQDAYKAFLAGPGKATVAEMARDPRKYGQFNIALLPGTEEEVTKATAAGVPELEMALSDGGVLLIGPRAAIRGRTSLAVYDMRDVIRRLNSKNKIQPAPSGADYQKAIVEVVQGGLKPDRDGTWGKAEDLGKATSVMIPYNGLLVVFATADTHRGVAAALQDIGK